MTDKQTRALGVGGEVLSLYLVIRFRKKQEGDKKKCQNRK